MLNINSSEVLLEKKSKLIIFAVIAAVNILIYYPSLYHIPRADQWCYLADTAAYDDWSSLITKFYSYNRVRLFNPGDSFLFRPVIFFLLGTEKWAFGYNFFYWQLTGIVLHLILVWWLLKLLLEIRPNIFAYLMTFFFSTLSVTQEMVIWHHINGYILFMIFVLGALYHVYLHLLEGQRSKWRIWLITGYLTMAAFTHELGVILIFFTIVFLLLAYSSHTQALKRIWITVLSIPFMLYFLTSYLDYLLHPHGDPSISGGFFSNHSDYLTVTKTIVGVLFSWIYAGIFPLMQGVELTVGGRLSCAMPDCQVLARNFFTLLNPLDYIGFGAVIVFSLVLITTFNSIVRFVQNRSYLSKCNVTDEGRRLVLKRLAFFFYLVIFFSIYITGITTARTLALFISKNNFLMFNMYYSYISWIFFIVMIYTLLSTLTPLIKIKSLYKYASVVVIIALILTNGYRVFEINNKMKILFSSTRTFIEQVDSFINVHKNESDCSFTFINHPQVDISLWFLKKSEDKPEKKYFLSDILYGKYLIRKPSKYFLRINEHYKNTFDVYKTDMTYLL